MGVRSILEGIKNKKVLVIGTCILDEFIYGDTTRLNPEAPVPVLNVKETTTYPGGAANIACNIASLGGNATLVGIVGDTPVLSELLKNKVTSHLITQKNKETTRRKRYIGKSQQMLYLDQPDFREPTKKTVDIFKKTIEELIPKHDVVVLYDEHEELLELRKDIITLSRKHKKPLVADVKQPFKGPTFIILNQEPQSMKAYNTTFIVSKGKEGAYIYPKKGKTEHIPTKKLDIFDITGAGETFTAAFALGLIATSIPNAVNLANIAAGVAITKKGLVEVSQKDVLSHSLTHISDLLQESILVKQEVIENQMHIIDSIVRILLEAYKKKKKILICGNGGSAADAQHFAAELVCRFKINRRGLPAIALTTDSSILTAAGNDFGFDHIFEKQVEALANKGDVLIGISTSGNSPNVIKAFDKARECEAYTIAFSGKDGGKMKDHAELNLIVPSNNTPRIQETHIAIIHIICEYVEIALFKK